MLGRKLTEEQRQLLKDYKGTFATEEGKRVLKNLSNECYETLVTFVEDKNGGALGTAYNEGKRYVIMHIRRLIEQKPD